MDVPAKLTILERGKGPQILLTAGSDGDEYDGIQAATQLIEQWKHHPDWQGVRMVQPVINQLGYAVGVSYDPVSGVFPKHTTPPFWYSLPFRPDLWIDLHGGNRNESLTPFVWGFPYGSTQMKIKTVQILNSLSPTITVLAPWQKAAAVAAAHCLYIVCESGERGEINPQSVTRHITWVEQIIRAFVSPVLSTHHHINQLQYVSATTDGYWRPVIRATEQIQAGQVVGYLSTNAALFPCVARISGIVLWYHLGGWVKADENLGAIGKYPLRKAMQI